jgi:hypothetical protein
MFVTCSGRAVAAQPDGLARLQVEQRLGVELHPRPTGKVRSQFLLGDAELAVFAAMKEVGVRVRDVGGEQEAPMALFRAPWACQGPHQPPAVDYRGPTVAAEAVLLAELLLRMLHDTTPRPTQGLIAVRAARQEGSTSGSTTVPSLAAGTVAPNARSRSGTCG